MHGRCKELTRETIKTPNQTLVKTLQNCHEEFTKGLDQSTDQFLIPQIDSPVSGCFSVEFRLIMKSPGLQLLSTMKLSRHHSTFP